MILTISIRFLTGRAHLHPWQSHHSEGRVEWPPSHWRLLRAIVAVAGRGLTSLSGWDEFADPGSKPKTTKKNPEPLWPPAGYESLCDTPDGVANEIPLSRLAGLLKALSTTPFIWLPRTGGGHTRQYFPIHKAGMVKNTGSAVFDMFATISKSQPLLFHWPHTDLDSQQELDLCMILSRMTYFGRAESWCLAQVHRAAPETITGVAIEGRNRTHWRCVCIEDAEGGTRPEGIEYRDYTLERRLAPVKDIRADAIALLPRCATSETAKQKADGIFGTVLESESTEVLLLRCLLRESGQDIKDGLERPVGTRWVHYAVPRAIYDVPRAKPQARQRLSESVNLVRYALNTATVNRAVLPPLTDTLLVADQFRAAIMALRGTPSRSLSGHESDGAPLRDNDHASWWPMDGDNDGFIDHVMVWTPGAFESDDIDALRSVTRIRQRGGRPDLLVTPTYVGVDSEYSPWLPRTTGEAGREMVSEFVSATPYFCPVHLSHGRNSSGRSRPIVPELMKGLRIKGVIATDGEIDSIEEIVFDYAPSELAATVVAVASGDISEPVPPRQFFPAVDPFEQFPPFPRGGWAGGAAFAGAWLKDPDEAFTFGMSVGLMVNRGTRFIRAAGFCRRRRQHQVKGIGRMFRIRFCKPREPRPFAIGDQCHYGLGLFIPA